jgi:hypothetical protein
VGLFFTCSDFFARHFFIEKRSFSRIRALFANQGSISNTFLFWNVSGLFCTQDGSLRHLRGHHSVVKLRHQVEARARVAAAGEEVEEVEEGRRRKKRRKRRACQ